MKFLTKSIPILLITLLASGCETQPTSSSEQLITGNSAGPIKLGMTVAEVRRAMPTTTISRHADGEGVAWISVDQGDDWLLTLYAGEEDWEAPIDENAQIEFIEVWHADFKTAEGVHPGMALKNAENKYGGFKEIMMSEIEAREYAEFIDKPAGLLFRLTHPNGMAGDYPSGENTSINYRPGATIFAISAVGGDF